MPRIQRHCGNSTARLEFRAGPEPAASSEIVLDRPQPTPGVLALEEDCRPHVTASRSAVEQGGGVDYGPSATTSEPSPTAGDLPPWRAVSTTTWCASAAVRPSSGRRCARPSWAGGWR